MKKVAYPVPKEILRDHVAVIATTGAGKSNTGRLIMEAVLSDGLRAGAIDMTGVWWGIKASADGKQPGYPVVIFGGQHADVEINDTMGGKLGKMLATTHTPFVIDLSDFSVSASVRFLTPFFAELYLHNKTTIHLMLDEADRYAPQSVKGREQLLHNTVDLASRGRHRGFRLTIISQRPAKLHKDVLTQAKAMVFMQLIAPHDRKAAKTWIEDQADEEAGKTIIKSLPSLSTGEAHIWAPQQDVLERVQFPLCKTYDSMKAPEPGDNRDKVKLASVDLDQIKAALAPPPKPAAPAPKRSAQKSADFGKDALAAARQEGYAAGVRASDREFVRWKRSISKGLAQIRASQGAIEKAVARLEGEIDTIETVKTSPETPKISPPARKSAPERIVSPETDTTRLAAPETAILSAIGWWESAGHPNPTKGNVAFIAGYKPGSGTVNNLFSRLRTLGLLDYDPPGHVVLTNEGLAKCPPPDRAASTEELQKTVLTQLSGPQQRMLHVLIDQYPAEITKGEAAQACEYAPGSGTVNNIFSKLKTLTLITYSSPGSVRASDWLFLD